MTSIGLAINAPLCLSMFSSSANRLLSVLRPGEAGRLRTGAFIRKVCFWVVAGSLMGLIGYHPWLILKVSMIVCRPQPVRICISVCISVAGYGTTNISSGMRKFAYEESLIWSLYRVGH